MKIVPGITWASGDTVTHTKLNNFLLNATIGSGDQSDVALGDGALDSLTDGTDNVALGDNAGTAVTSGDDNVLIGQNAGLLLSTGSFNVVMGKDAFNATTSGYVNVAVGQDAMGASTGDVSQNVAIGAYALNSVAGDVTSTEASYNTAIGNHAGEDFTTGYGNCVMGYGAGQNMTTNSSNNVVMGHGAMSETTSAVDTVTAVGYRALDPNEADSNTGIGAWAGQDNTSGEDNTFVGNASGYSNTTGDDNTFVGDFSGYHNTGDSNTALGSASNVTLGAAAYTNTTVLGYNAQSTASNQVTLGNSLVTGLKCYQTTVSSPSDSRIKKNVKDNKIGLDFINALRTVSFKKINPFNWPDEIKEECFKVKGPDGKGKKASKPEDNNSLQHGFIAQEVKAVMDDQGIDEWGGHEVESNGMNVLGYGAMVVPLVKAVQELTAKVAALEAAG